MSGYKTDQRYLRHRGRAFHFVSYEGQHANPGRDQEATPPAWFLMRAGKRWPVAPQVMDQDPDALDLQFIRWLDQHVFEATEQTTAPTPPWVSPRSR